VAFESGRRVATGSVTGTCRLGEVGRSAAIALRAGGAAPAGASGPAGPSRSGGADEGGRTELAPSGHISGGIASVTSCRPASPHAREHPCKRHSFRACRRIRPHRRRRA
jgi:hypothetical protein